MIEGHEQNGRILKLLYTFVVRMSYAIISFFHCEAQLF